MNVGHHECCPSAFLSSFLVVFLNVACLLSSCLLSSAAFFCFFICLLSVAFCLTLARDTTKPVAIAYTTFPRSRFGLAKSAQGRF